MKEKKSTPQEGTIHVFPDTNIFLHFAAFDGMDWQALCETEAPVQIHVSQALLAELNKLKDTGATSTVRKRSAGAIKKLREIHNYSRSSPSGTTVVFSDTSPDVSRFQRLNPNVQDDHLLAEILQFASENPGESVVLATDDGGFGLTVKAGHHGVKWVEPPLSAKLPSEPEPHEVELHKLRSENERLRNVRPIPKVCFGDGAQILTLPGPPAEWQSRLREILREVREKHPEMSVPKPSGNAFSISMLSIYRTPEKVADYNERLSIFLQKMESTVAERLSAKSRTIFFDLKITNQGTSPAEDLRLHIHFPDGFTLRNKEEWDAYLKDLPRPPEPPEPNIRGFGDITRSLSMAHFPRPSYEAPESTISIRRTNSYDLNYRLKKLQQHETKTISSMALTFDLNPFPFQAEYRITADNLLDPFLGTLIFSEPPARTSAVHA